jgi:hypothetical protein
VFTCTQTPEQVVALLKIKNVKPRVSIAPDRLSVDVYFGKEKSTLKLEAPVASFRLDVSPQNVTVTLRKDKDALWSTLPGPPPQSKQKTPPLPNSTVPAPSPPGPPVEGHSPQTSASAASRGYDHMREEHLLRRKRLGAESRSSSTRRKKSQQERTAAGRLARLPLNRRLMR